MEQERSIEHSETLNNNSCLYMTYPARHLTSIIRHYKQPILALTFHVNLSLT